MERIYQICIMVGCIIVCHIATYFIGKKIRKKYRSLLLLSISIPLIIGGIVSVSSFIVLDIMRLFISYIVAVILTFLYNSDNLLQMFAKLTPAFFIALNL